MSEVRSGDALYACDDSMTIIEWNEAAEKLTGIPAVDAIGEKCWDVIRGRTETGELVCHPGCSVGRLVGEGWPVPCRVMLVKTPTGRKPLNISTILVKNGSAPLVLHPMHNGIEVPDEEEPEVRVPPLTPRQREVLAMLADGVPAKTIAARLSLAETTIRNHIRAILLELGAHSQLEAVAKARRLGVLA